MGYIFSKKANVKHYLSDCLNNLVCPTFAAWQRTPAQIPNT